MGLADIALFEGRDEEAAAALPAAIETDTRARNMAGAAAKPIALAEAHAGLGRNAIARAQAGEAMDAPAAAKNPADLWLGYAGIDTVPLIEGGFIARSA